MIYLIDDKKLRQEKDYNWSSERLVKYGKFIITIYTLIELQNRNQEIFQEGNIILYHESFIDKTQIHKEAVERRKKLEEFSKNKSSYLVFFSGSKSDRDLKNNIANIPVSVLYKNLEVFIQKYSENDIKLEYLLFGENPRIEETLINKLNDGLLITQSELPTTTNKENLFIRPSKNNINQPLNTCNEKVIFNKCSDEDFSEKILEWLNDSEYDNIFVPLCFGKTLSDFNGLRLATHIRCTNTRNQTTPLYIYGFVGIEYLLENEYFNILRTKNVFLIPFSKKAIGEAAEKTLPPFPIKELPKEIAKLKLDVPKNYADNHSIANEWAIHQWAKTIGCDETDELTKVFQNVQTNLYFKYLSTINPVSELDRITPEKLKINCEDNPCEDNPKVLLIDDEAEKGWYKIFTYLLGDLNEIYIDYLGDDFKNQSQEDIINKSIKKIKEDDIDVVILDFRLNPNDFTSPNPMDISSIRLLKKIKEFNPGIQVIIFSATNKVWNLQALQDAGIDGFIFKDGNENIHRTINSLIGQMSLSLKKASWLKPIWSNTNSIINHLEKQRKNHILDRDFTGAINTFLELGFESLLNEHNKFSYDSAFMYYFLILEVLSKQLIDEETPHKIDYTNIHGETKKGFKFQFRSNYTFLKDYQGNRYMQVAAGDDLISINKRIPYSPKFHNLISQAGCEDIDPVSIVDLRNKFNHPDLIENRRTAVIEKGHVNKIFKICTSLLNNL